MVLSLFSHKLERSLCLSCLCLNFLFSFETIIETTPHQADTPPKTTETGTKAIVDNKETLETPDKQLTVFSA